MKIFVDTNIFLDVFLKREKTEGSLEVLSVIRFNSEGFICPITITNIDFIMRKETKEDREKAIKYILNNFHIIELNKKILIEAMNTSFKDFEDSVQFVSAKEYACEAIITRNKKDFKESTIKIFTPEEFLEFYDL